MSVSLEDLGKEVCKDFEHMSADRGLFEAYWDDIARVLWPEMRNTFRAGSFNSPGERKNDLQMDSTPQLALSRFSAILTSLLTPPNQKWHFVRSSLPELNKIRAVAEWFEIVNDSLFRFRNAAQANFKGQNRLSYAGLGSFGSTAMFIDKLDGSPGLRYKNVHVGECYFRDNHQGVIDTVLRRFELTARQAAQRKDWEGRLPAKIAGDAVDKPDTKYVFFHRVKPREDHDPDALDERSLPLESVYVSEFEKAVLATGGFNTMPYATSRYEQAPGEVYGRSPAMQSFPAIRTLMSQKRVVLTQGHRAVNPILLTADDGAIDIALRPGTIIPNSVNSANGKALVQGMPVGDVQLGRDMMEDERAVIKDGFLVSLFQILVETPDRMTATQVLERAQEKGQLLAPTVGAQEDYLGQVINREIDILARQGLIPPLPEELAEASNEYTIEYDNPLTRAARSGEVAGLFRLLESIIPVMELSGDLSPLDHIDMDTATPEIASINAVPVRWTNSLDKIQAIRTQRAQAQQQQQQIEAAPGQAALVKAAATAKEKGLTEEDLQ